MARKPTQTRHTHNGTSFDIMPRTNTKGDTVWYIGVIDTTGRKRYTSIRSTKQTGKQRALEVAVKMIEAVEDTPVDTVTLRGFIDEMWAPGSDFLTTRARNRKTGKRIGALHAHNSLGWLTRHFLPWCDREGVTMLHELTPANLSRWMTELATYGRVVKDRRPLSIASVEKVRKTVNVTLVQAAKMGYIEQNPLHGIDAGEVGPDEVERTAASREHIPMPWLVKILDPVHWAEHWALTMAYLSTITGGREGELRALTWDSIDMDGATITITASWDNFTGAAKPPKSAKGYRTLPIDDTAVSYLTRLRDITPWKDDTDIVFYGLTRGRPVSPGRALYHLRQAAKRAGVPLEPGKHSFHSLRHTLSSYSTSMSIDDRMAILGHSHESITAGYTHVTEAQIEELRRVQRDMFTLVKTG